jgi:subtilisin family serine protease
LRSRSKDVRTLLNELQSNPDVIYAEPNYIVRTTATPNDNGFGQLWGLNNTGQAILGAPGVPGAHISAVSAWNISTGNRNTVVGVVDSGIDYNHPDLAANVWSAPSAFSVIIAGVAINCAAGTHGFNAINNTCNPLDDNNHGTHVAGTIGSAGNNGTGITGVNWTASIMGLKFLNSSGSGNISDAIEAIEFARQVKQIFPATANVRVLNSSWGGGGFSQALLDQINAANAAGMLFVASAGNSGRNNDFTAQYPANYSAPNVVSVAATTNTDSLAGFSNFGAATVDLGAPGDDILSTIRGGSYAYFSGTSMASPHVAGAAALLLSACSLDTASLKNTLFSTVDPIGSLAGKTVTGGRLNVDRAIRSCASPTPNFSLTATPSSATVTAGNSASFNVTSAPSGGFASNITLSVSGLPAGATAGFATNPIGPSGSSQMTVTTAATTPAGTFTLTITGTQVGGSLVRSKTVQLTVNAPATPNFTLSGTPAAISVTRGSPATFTIKSTPSGGFSSNVSLSVSGLPAGTTASFATNPIGPSGSSQITVNTTAATPTGTFTVTITGTQIGGSLVRSTTVALTVSASGNPDFTLSISPTAQNVKRGGTAVYTVTATPVNGFNSPISLTISGKPDGAKATFTPSSSNPPFSSTLSLHVFGPHVRFITFNMTITGTGGGLSRATTATMTVVP